MMEYILILLSVLALIVLVAHSFYWLITLSNRIPKTDDFSFEFDEDFQPKYFFK